MSTDVESITERVDRILSEDPIGLSQAARILGTFREGRPTSPATMFRWITRGTVLPDGRRLKLEAIRIARRFMTSRAAILRFLTAQQADVNTTPAKSKSKSQATRNRASAAGERLKKMGA